MIDNYPDYIGIDPPWEPQHCPDCGEEIGDDGCRCDREKEEENDE